MECRRDLAMRILSVRPSIRLSVKRVNCDKTEEKSVQILYHTKDLFAYSFLRKRMVGGGRRLLPQILGQSDRVGAKSPILNR